MTFQPYVYPHIALGRMCTHTKDNHMSNEKAIIVKLQPEDKNALERQAAENGRAMMREAEVLIKRGIRKPRRKGRAQ